MAYILTDSAQRFFDADDKNAIEVVKVANISADDIGEYSPFALFYMVGEVCTRNGFNVKSITQSNKKNVKIEGFTKRGILPIPISETLSVGDKYTADGIFSVSSDGSSRTEGSVEITEIIVCKNEDDIASVLNAMQKLGTQFGRKIKMAEQDDGFVPETLMKAEEVFSAESYESFMAELGMDSYPQDRFYLSNV